MDPTLAIRPYRLPLARPWQSAVHCIPERLGWLVIATGGGISGYGDCAPLPESGTEGPADALVRLEVWQAAARGSTIEDLLRGLSDQWPNRTPAADYAVETALLDLSSRLHGLTLRQLLGEDSTPVDQVAVNAALGPLDEGIAEAATRAVTSGFSVLKLKVGIHPAADEIRQIHSLAGTLPAGALLRLDANRAWGSEAAETFISDLADLPIESLEEPLHAYDPALLDRLQRSTPISLALDETLGELDRPIASERLPVRRLVLKPGVIGGLRPTLNLARRAHACGLEVVLTSLVETAAGLWATAQLATLVGGGLVHGLDTASWLGRDLGPAPTPNTGSIALPTGPGSGFEPG